MINLISGVPGSGKTAYALDFMLQQSKEGRKLFVHGIPQLKIPHVDVYCDSPNCDVCTNFTEDDKQNMHKANEWHEWAPDGAVLFFDEVQNVYRPRASSSKPPGSIQAFEVHRHRGLDFYLISQSPKLFDSNIRELISRHIHLRSTWAGRFQYEWPECKTQVQSTSDAIKSSYKLNTKIFDLYHSASLHTKQKHKLPPAVYVFGLCLVVMVLIGGRVYSRISDFSGGAALQAGTPALSSLNSISSVPFQKSTSDQPEINFLDFKPQVKGILESAPAYSEIVKVKDFPRISACISGENSCTCYTQQMTVYPTQLQQCLDFIERDTSSFNPYINVEEDRKQNQQRLIVRKDNDI